MERRGERHRGILALVLESWHRRIATSGFGCYPTQNTARPPEFTHSTSKEPRGFASAASLVRDPARSVRLSGFRNRSHDRSGSEKSAAAILTSSQALLGCAGKPTGGK